MNHNKFTPTYNQVNEQGDQPTILIPRRDGTIQTATLVKVEDGSGYAAECQPPLLANTLSRLSEAA